MLSLTPACRIWLCTQPTDMRRSFDGLSALAAAIEAAKAAGLFAIAAGVN